MSKLTLETEGDRFVIAKRRFAAPPEAVYRAHLEPEILKQWATGPDGWTMPVCINEAKAGGKIRYEWTNGREGFYLTAEILELDPPHRIVHVERMHLPDPTPDCHVVTLFEADGKGGTLLTMRMTLPSEEARAAMLATGMEHGMEDSFGRLESVSGWSTAA